MMLRDEAAMKASSLLAAMTVVEYATWVFDEILIMIRINGGSRRTKGG